MERSAGEWISVSSSLLAIGSGGLFGQGFGLSIQKLQYLPFMYTDFIFAIYAEEFGLMGCTLFLVFLAVFSYVSPKLVLSAGIIIQN